MGYSVEVFIVDLMYGFFFNMIFVVFAVIAGLRAEHNKSPWGFFIAGVVIQSIASFGLLINAARDTYISSGNLTALIFTVVCFASGYLIVCKTYIRVKKKFDAAAKKATPNNNEQL